MKNVVYGVVSLLACGLSAEQGPETRPIHRGLPGAEPGSERWVVVLKTRSFDSRLLREAHRSGRPAEVTRVVAGLEAAAAADQRDFRSFVEDLGGQIERQWWLINACLIEVSPDLLGDVGRHARVLSLHPDVFYRPAIKIKESTNAQNHRADGVHARGFMGDGVAVAVLDSGQDSNMNGSGRPHRLYYLGGNPNNTGGGGLAGSRLLANFQIGAEPAEDGLGHGTGVAAISVGEKWNGAPTSDRGHAPEARVVGYAIADQSNGLTSTATIISAWQRVSADATRYGIRVANNSYHGDADPTHPAQQALCAAALAADLLIVVSAGNQSSTAISSQACVNGLAVGATTQTTRMIASFSSTGPLPGDYRRTYPDMVANGVDMVLPQPDVEVASGNNVVSGTSFAAPQVSGAAALYRSVVPTATHLETKAALLVTAEELFASSSNVSRNRYGLGYLRDDLLMELAQRRSGSVALNDKVTASGPSQTYRFNVTAGTTYAAAIAWDRHVVTSREWSDLDLEARQGASVLAVSRSPRNLYEKVVFRPAVTGAVDLVVTAPVREIASVPFALVIVEDRSGQGVPGSLAKFGAGCAGTGVPVGPADVFPQELETEFGLHHFEQIAGFGTHRVQICMDGAFLPAAPFTMRGLAMRQDERLSSRATNEWIELEMDMGVTTVAPGAMQSAFAANITGPMTKVFTKKRVSMPAWGAAGTDPRVFDLPLIFDTPLVWTGGGGQHLLIDAVRSNSSRGIGTFRFGADGILDPAGMPVSHVFNRTLTSPTGIVRFGEGPVLGFLTPTPRIVAPILEPQGKVRTGMRYTLNMLQAAAGQPAAMLAGVSNRVWSNTPLPLELSAYGAPGCSILTSIDVAINFAVGASGTYSQWFTVPNVPSAIQANVFHQVAIDDAGANSLGLSFTNGVWVIPGG